MQRRGKRLVQPCFGGNRHAILFFSFFPFCFMVLSTLLLFVPAFFYLFALLAGFWFHVGVFFVSRVFSSHRFSPSSDFITASFPSPLMAKNKDSTHRDWITQLGHLGEAISFLHFMEVGRSPNSLVFWCFFFFWNYHGRAKGRTCFEVEWREAGDNHRGQGSPVCSWPKFYSEEERRAWGDFWTRKPCRREEKVFVLSCEEDRESQTPLRAGLISVRRRCSFCCFLFLDFVPGCVVLSKILSSLSVSLLALENRLGLWGLLFTNAFPHFEHGVWGHKEREISFF